jgi:branched-chain amino acid transport system ATP-binding protein
MADSVLKVEGLQYSFGALKVTDRVTFEVMDGEILGVIGPNGAGKSTLFALLAGNLIPTAGQIVFRGIDVTTLPLHLRAQAGIARTHQIPRPFTHMSVFENLKVAALFGGALPSASVDSHTQTILTETGLIHVARTRAGALPLLLRKRLELARALAMRPRLLLVDEVAAGLTDQEVKDFIELIRRVRARGVAVVWIEHVIRAMRQAADRVLALHNGQVVAIGAAEEVLNAPAVRQVYLGEGHTAGKGLVN